jgi:hypothetical protein
MCERQPIAFRSLTAPLADTFHDLGTQPEIRHDFNHEDAKDQTRG